MSRSTMTSSSALPLSAAARATLFIALVLTTAEATQSTRPTSSAASRCPSYCSCSDDGTTDSGIAVDCRGKRLTTVEDTIEQLDERTTRLDLRNNQITTIGSRSFTRLGNLSVLLLDENHIDDIQPHAFQGLLNIALLSLTANNLTTIRSDAFAEIAGACHDGGGGGVGSGATSCTVDLTRNSVAVVERNAFAWIQRLRIKLGRGGDVPMTIGAYSFYGARHVRRIEVGGVPRVTLKPRIFTNAEDVGSIEVLDTRVDRIDEFVFEGLRNVDSITFTRVDVGLVESFAFSGIHFRKRRVANSAPPTAGNDDRAAPAAESGRKSVKQREAARDEEKEEMKSRHREERHAQSGGLVSFDDCRLRKIRSDSFRDANVAHIEISKSHIDDVERHAFQSVVGLESLSIVGCHFASGRLVTDSLASLRGLDRIEIVDNDFTVIEPFSFRDVIDTGSIHVRFRSSLDNVTLMTEAFGYVSDVDELRLSGGGHDAALMSSSTGSRTRINVDVGAFRNLVGARHVIIENVRLPTIRRHALSGLSRIGNLTIANCDVTSIEREAFGTSASHFGAIEHFDIRSGNQLACDCSTGGGLLRELELHFSSYVASCSVDNVTLRRRAGFKSKTQIELRNGAERSTTYAMMCGAALRTLGSLPNALISLIFALFLGR